MDNSNPNSYCSHCNEQIKVDALYCSSCGFPEKGTENEKAKFHAQKVMKTNARFDAIEKVGSARTTLFVIAGFTFLIGIIYHFANNDLAVLISNLILSIIYIALAFWSNQKPFAAILLGLLLYITVTILNTALDPSALYKGILIKIIIILYLVKGVYSARSVLNK